MEGIFWLMGAAIIAIVLVGFIWYGQFRLRLNNSDAHQHTKNKTSASLKNDLLILSVIAKEGRRFESYDLLQAISATGMRYGEMNIFHYYAPGNDKMSLFSLASATEPGEIDLDHIGEFSCKGLILFTRLSEISNPPYVFKMMMKIAEQLAEDLEGELRADPKTPWNETVLRQYQHKINQAKTIEYVS